MSTQTTHGSGAQSPASSVGAVGQETKGAAADVASTAGDEIRNVARETSDQARRLWQQTRSDLTDQASTQQDRAAQGLRTLSDQLQGMSGSADEGLARDLVDDVARRAGELAGWLENRDPGALLEEARGFAQRKPGTFLALAAGLGVVAGRMSRSLVDEKREEHATSHGPGGTTGGTVSTGPGASGAAIGSGSAAGTGAIGEGIPTATSPTTGTTQSTPVSPGSSAATTEAAGSVLPGPDLPGPHRTTQPIDPDGTPTPNGDDGFLEGPPGGSTGGGTR